MKKYLNFGKRTVVFVDHIMLMRKVRSRDLDILLTGGHTVTITFESEESIDEFLGNLDKNIDQL